mmetsp:Transcript_32991/g.71406  ORF Transcript_32991/g.71406 Transcript_32991/m.71406 type:complete len:103 (-) Transcript_32991:375-683(-)
MRWRARAVSGRKAELAQRIVDSIQNNTSTDVGPVLAADYIVDDDDLEPNAPQRTDTFSRVVRPPRPVVVPSRKLDLYERCSLRPTSTAGVRRAAALGCRIYR